MALSKTKMFEDLEKRFHGVQAALKEQQYYTADLQKQLSDERDVSQRYRRENRELENRVDKLLSVVRSLNGAVSAAVDGYPNEHIPF